MKTPKHVEFILQKAGLNPQLCPVSKTNGGHLRVSLPNDLFVICASSPGDKRGHLNKAAEIRRMLRDPASFSSAKRIER